MAIDPCPRCKIAGFSRIEDRAALLLDGHQPHCPSGPRRKRFDFELIRDLMCRVEADASEIDRLRAELAESRETVERETWERIAGEIEARADAEEADSHRAITEDNREYCKVAGHRAAGLRAAARVAHGGDAKGGEG